MYGSEGMNKILFPGVKSSNPKVAKKFSVQTYISSTQQKETGR